MLIKPISGIEVSDYSINQDLVSYYDIIEANVCLECLGLILMLGSRGLVEVCHSK